MLFWWERGKAFLKRKNQGSKKGFWQKVNWVFGEKNCFLFKKKVFPPQKKKKFKKKFFF